MDTVNIFRADSDRVAYILMPMPQSHAWLAEQAVKHNVNIATIGGMDWDNDLTPWPAPGEPPGDPDFQGLAPQFLKHLTGALLPVVEAELGVTDPERTLVGISLSGLFAVWAWMQGDEFLNIASISGSFWYDGFVSWLQRQPCPKKSGRLYLSLGVEEPHSPVKAFRPVGAATQAVEDYFRQNGITTLYQQNPGNHFAPLEPRLRRALAYLFPS